MFYEATAREAHKWARMHRRYMAQANREQAGSPLQMATIRAATDFDMMRIRAQCELKHTELYL
jgi:hypothetical protein